MSAKRSLSAKLSRREPSDDEFDASLAEFQSAHDRIAAIMGAALVENTLVDAIKVCLDDDSNTSQLFYEDKSPFGTFYARIVAAKGFALISERLAEDLHIIRNIRNQFAHSVLCLDFKNEHIAAECEKLKRYPNWPELRRKRTRSRRYYQNACYTLTVYLLKQVNRKLAEETAELERKNQELKLKSLQSERPEKFGLTALLQAYSGINAIVSASHESGSQNFLGHLYPQQFGIGD
jgi:hypothetical protein